MVCHACRPLPSDFFASARVAASAPAFAAEPSVKLSRASPLNSPDRCWRLLCDCRICRQWHVPRCQAHHRPKQYFDDSTPQEPPVISSWLAKVSSSWPLMDFMRLCSWLSASLPGLSTRGATTHTHLVGGCRILTGGWATKLPTRPTGGNG